MPDTDTLTAADLAALRALLADASPGPWSRDEPGANMGEPTLYDARGWDLLSQDMEGGWYHFFDKMADADFVVAIRNAAPALLTLAERALSRASRQMTHSAECWRWPGHEGCAVNEAERQRRIIRQVTTSMRATANGYDNVSLSDETMAGWILALEGTVPPLLPLYDDDLLAHLDRCLTRLVAAHEQFGGGLAPMAYVNQRTAEYNEARDRLAGELRRLRGGDDAP